MQQTDIYRIVAGLVGMVVAHLLTTWLHGKFSQWFPLKVEPWLYEPLERGEAPPKHAEWFDEVSPLLDGLGWQHLGDFLVKQKPHSTARCYLHPDATTLAVIESYHGENTFACVSLCADHKYVETVMAASDLPEVPLHIPLLFAVADPETPEAVIEQHPGVLAAYCAGAQTEPLPMAADDFREVLLYGQRLVVQLMQAQGFAAVMKKA
jgi:hypothetical protein